MIVNLSVVEGLIKNIKMKKIFLFFVFISTFSFAQKSELKKQILNLTANKNATIAVSVKGIDFPFTFNNENANKKLPMLSVFKFHIALATLNLVDKGDLKIDQKFLIKKEDLLSNTYSPFRNKFPEGNIYVSLNDLIYYSVSLSDNNTTDILLRIIGGTAFVQKFLEEKNVKNFQIKNNEAKMHENAKYIYENYTTTKSLSQLYKDFYKEKILTKKSTNYLYNILLNTTTGANKLKEQLPKSFIAHKTGSSGTDENGFTIADNDSGIITLPNGKHYAITVFVSDSKENEKTNPKLISDISKIIWDFLVKK